MRRVLLVAACTLFGKDVENWLSQEPSMDLISRESDIVKALEKMKYAKPDVVIVEKSILNTDLGHEFRNMLWSLKKLKVIELDPSDKIIEIHCNQQKYIKKVQDLLDVIDQ